MRRKIELMHQMFGKIEGKQCLDCSHLCSYTQSRKWYKCEVYGLSSSEASDWRLKYPACGLFNKETKYREVINLRKCAKSSDEPDEPLEGQINFFDCLCEG